MVSRRNMCDKLCKKRRFILIPIAVLIITLANFLRLPILWTESGFLASNVENVCQFHTNKLPDHPKEKANNREQRVKVLLVSAYRSGSSFVGEILNNKDTFYSFEPLYFVSPLHTFATRMSLEKTKVGHLEQLMHCNSTSLEEISKSSLKPSDIQYWIKRSFPQSGSFAKAMEMCKRKPHISMKVIRINDISEAVPRLSRQGVQVLYLVRDPRGTFSSRIKNFININRASIIDLENNIEFISRLTAEIRHHCTTISSNLKYIKRNYVVFKYTLRVLRYEDFAYCPHTMAKLLYNFLGQNLPKSVANFLETHTNLSPLEAAIWNWFPYSVKRRSSATAEAWRNYLPKNFVQLIEQECGNVLTDLGYSYLNRSKINTSESVVEEIVTKHLPLL